MRYLSQAVTALLIGLGAFDVTALDLEELRAAGRLSTQVIVETKAPLYQRAPIMLAVEVATPRWFSRGTRVRDFRIPGAVVRPVSTFADNQSQRINGETWSVQRWRYRVFAFEAGTLEIPSLRVSVSVNTEDHGVVDGELQVASPTLALERPPGTELLEDWVAAVTLSVDQAWEGQREEYEIGDALTLVRRYRISDAPAMVIAGSTPPQIDGMAMYAAPPLVEDRSNRGRLEGVREERFVYTFEQSGSYTIPGLSVFWFNTTTTQVEEIRLDDLTVTVRGALTDAPGETWERPSLLQWIVSALLIAGLGFLGNRLRNAPLSKRLGHQLKMRRERKLAFKGYRLAVRNRDSERCVALLYARLDPGKHRQLATAIGGDTLQQLLGHAYGDALAPPSSDDLMELWRKAGAAETSQESESRLTLNPLPSGHAS